MPLLIATKNPGKIAEMAEWLTRAGIAYKTLRDFPEVADVEETGATFEENAKLKAFEYFKATGLPTLADDGGFEIDYLSGSPGVKSKRWVYGDREATDEELVAHTLLKLKGVPTDRRTARLRSVMALYDGKEYMLASTAIEGVVAETATAHVPGFPYRGLLYVSQFGKMYDELSHEEHEAVNHRRLSLEKLKPVLVLQFGGVA